MKYYIPRQNANARVRETINHSKLYIIADVIMKWKILTSCDQTEVLIVLVFLDYACLDGNLPILRSNFESF